MSDEESDFLSPFPSGKRKKKAAKRGGKKKRKAKPKYREMVLRAVKSLREPKGSSYNSIAKYIEERYKVRNDFVLKHVIKWLCQKKVLTKKGAKVKLSGKPLKLGAKGFPKSKKPKKAKKSKRKRR